MDLSCPLEKGYRKVEKEVEIPGGVPSGVYDFVVEVRAEGRMGRSFVWWVRSFGKLDWGLADK